MAYLRMSVDLKVLELYSGVWDMQPHSLGPEDLTCLFLRDTQWIFYGPSRT
jgi:hypothetical protein